MEFIHKLKFDKMKKLTLLFLTATLLFSFAPLQMKAAIKTTNATTIKAKPNATDEAKVLIDRLNQIKTTDKSNMTAGEKKELRQEVRSLKSELKGIGGGVYLSVGAILIIALLLILLL
jgi:hypothetical protein